MSNIAQAIAAPAAPAQEAQKPNSAPGTETPQAPDPRQDQFVKREKQLRQMQQKLQMEKAAWDTERGGWRAKEQEYETNYIPRSRLAEDPLSALQEAGVTYDKLTEIVLNSPNSNDPTIRALRAEIKALAEKQSQSEAKQAEGVKNNYEQAKKQIDTEIKLIVDSDPEFESIREAGQQSAVWELIEQTFNEDGYLMDVKEAAKQVETYLVEQAYKMAQLPKVQSRLKPKVEEPTLPVPQRQQITPKTISNNMVSSTSTGLTDKERRARAIAAFKGELK